VLFQPGFGLVWLGPRLLSIKFYLAYLVGIQHAIIVIREIDMSTGRSTALRRQSEDTIPSS
jgi:hypothetical protein